VFVDNLFYELQIAIFQQSYKRLKFMMFSGKIFDHTRHKKTSGSCKKMNKPHFLNLIFLWVF